MLTLNDGRSELWQWDTGRKLTVDADCSQVHFSNKVFGRSIDVDVVVGVAIIPDILLQTDKDLMSWAFVGTPENGYTKISKVFKVNKRNKPADYVFTPTDQTTLGDILDRIEDLEKRPSTDVSDEQIQNAVNNYLEENPVEVDIPEALPNPHKLKFTGAVQAEYDGSKSVEIEIPYNEVTESQHKYELLEKITIEYGNEIDSIVRDGWVLDAVTVRIIAPTEATDASIRVYFKNNGTNLASHQIGVSSKQWTVLTLTKQLGHWQFVFFKQLQNAQAQLQTQPRYYNAIDTESFPNIGRIELAELAALTGGTTIEILGVRHESGS